MAELPAEVRNFAEMFIELQMARQSADYALDADAYTMSDVLGYMASAELTIDDFEQADIGARRSLAAHALFRRRPQLGGAG